MDIISMTAFAAAIDESSLLKIRDEFPYFSILGGTGSLDF